MIDFSLKKSMFKEIFELLVQFSIETYEKNSPENYTLLSFRMTFMKDKFTQDQEIYFAQ